MAGSKRPAEMSLTRSAPSPSAIRATAWLQVPSVARARLRIPPRLVDVGNATDGTTALALGRNSYGVAFTNGTPMAEMTMFRLAGCP